MITAIEYTSLLGMAISDVADGMPVRADGLPLTADQRAAAEWFQRNSEATVTESTVKELAKILGNRIVGSESETPLLARYMGYVDRIALQGDTLTASEQAEFDGLRALNSQTDAIARKSEQIRAGELPATLTALLAAFNAE